MDVYWIRKIGRRVLAGKGDSTDWGNYLDDRALSSKYPDNDWTPQIYG